MNIKIWLLVVIIIAALVIGYFVGTSMKKETAPTVAPLPAATEPSKGMGATPATSK